MNPWSLTEALDEAISDPWITEESPIWVLVDGVQHLFEVTSVEREPRADAKGAVVLKARRMSAATAQALIVSRGVPS